MNADFFKDIITSESIDYSSNESDSGESVNEDVKEIYKQFKKKHWEYDPDNDVYFIDINSRLKNRYKCRIRFFNNLKAVHNLEFTHKANDMFYKLLDFFYYAKSVKYLYFMKKISDFYNIPNDIKVKNNKKYDKMWNDFLKMYS